MHTTGTIRTFSTGLMNPSELSTNYELRKRQISSYLNHASYLRIRNGSMVAELSIDQNSHYRIRFTRGESGKSRRKTEFVVRHGTQRAAIESLVRLAGSIDRVKDIAAPICPYCQKPSVLECMPGRDNQPPRYRWICKPCLAWVWCHNDTPIPMGTPARKDLRELRKKGHEIINEIAETYQLEITEIYALLACKMRRAKKNTHLGMMGVSECSEAIMILRRIQHACE